MLNQIILFFVGAIGGILGGMGMGGGTILIPLLSIFNLVAQKQAQAINLISFIPMAIVVLIIHVKNKLVKGDKILYIIIPATAFAVLGSIISTLIGGDILRRVFGGFLIVLSVLEFFSDKIVNKFLKSQKN